MPERYKGTGAWRPPDPEEEKQKRFKGRGGSGGDWRLSPETKVSSLLQPLTTGVEGYTPFSGTLAPLPQDQIDLIEKQIGGQMDNTLKNLVFAHYQIFGTWPDFDLTADILNHGEVEFETLEEAMAFFSSVKEGYSGTGRSWQLESSGASGIPGQEVPGWATARVGAEGKWSAETDVLDPEMIASFRPKKVEDFLFGPYMKRSIPGKSSMFRESTIRLDEMLIQVPRQWAISQLAEGVGRQGRKENPDLDEDEALMLKLNKFLIDRIPDPAMRPAPTAAWQTNTEKSLRFLQMMRASAIYMASGENGEARGEEAAAAAGFLQQQGFGDVLGTLDEQIRTMAIPSGSTPDEQRKALDQNAAMIEQMWVASRNPGVLPQVALNQLHDLNPNACTLKTQQQVGRDGMLSRFGMLKGIANFVPNKIEGIPVPGGGDIGDVEQAIWDSDEMRALRTFIPATASAIVGVIGGLGLTNPYTGQRLSVGQAVGGSFSALVKYYEERHIDLVSLHQYEQDIGAGGGGTAETDLATAQRIEAWSEYLTIHHKAHKDTILDMIPGLATIGGVAFGGFGHDIEMESMGDFIEHWKWYHENNTKAKEAGIPMQYTDELMRDHGINPALNPEFSFLAGFAFDTMLDLAIIKGAGLGYQAVRGTAMFRSASLKAASNLHISTVKQVMAKSWEESQLWEDVADGSLTRGINLAKPTRGTGRITNRNEFTAKMQSVFGLYKDDIRDITHALENGTKLDGTPGTVLEILDDAIPRFTNTGKKVIYPDQWAIFESAKEKMLYDASSVFYRQKHPYLTAFLERTYATQKFSVAERQAEASGQRLASNMRTTIGKTKGGFDWSVKRYIDEAILEGDVTSARILLDIKENGDINRLADFLAGRFMRASEDVGEAARSQWEALHQMRLNGATEEIERHIIEQEKYVPDVKRLEGRIAGYRKSIASSIDRLNADLDYITPASKSYQKYMAKAKNRSAARIWFQHMDEMGYRNPDGSPIRHIPRKAERLAWEEKQKLPEDRITKGMVSQKEIVEQSLKDLADQEAGRSTDAVMVPSQDVSASGTKETRELSKAWRFKELEEMRAEEQRKLDIYNQLREDAGLLRTDEVIAADERLKAMLTEQELYKKMSREAHETTEQFDRRIADVAQSFIESRDIAEQTRAAEKFVEGRNIKDPKIKAEVLAATVKSYVENVKAQHARLRAIRNEAFDAVEEAKRMLPFDGPVEFGGAERGVHEQFARGMPRAGRRSAEARRVRDLQLERQVERSRLETILSGRQALEFRSTRTQMMEWISKAEAEVDDMTRTIAERLEPFMNLDPEGVMDTSKVAPELQDTLAALMETTPGEEIPITNAAEFITKINSFGGAPEDVARQALADFDTIFGSTALSREAQESLRLTLIDDLRNLDRARDHERIVKLIGKRELYYQQQNKGRELYPQINIIPEKGVMPTKTTEGAGLYSGPRWYRDGVLVGDDRLELPDAVRRRISSKMRRNEPVKGVSYGRQDAIDEMTEYLESVLLNRLTTVEHTARKKPWSLIHRPEDPPDVFYETHGRVPPGATEPLWTFEQRSAYGPQEDWLIKGQTTTKESELDLGKPAADRPTYHRDPADQRVYDALNEIMDEIWNRHIAGGASEFHVFGRATQKNVATWAGEPAGALQKRLPIVTGQTKGRYAEKLSDSGKRIVIDTKTNKAVADKPLILDTGKEGSPIHCPFVVEREAKRPLEPAKDIYVGHPHKAQVTWNVRDMRTGKIVVDGLNLSASDAKKLRIARYREYLESRKKKDIDRLMDRGKSEGALILEGDLKGTLHKFLTDFENSARRVNEGSEWGYVDLPDEGLGQHIPAAPLERKEPGLRYKKVPEQNETVIEGLWGETIANFIKNNIGARAPNNLRTLESEELFAQRVARRTAERAAGREVIPDVPITKSGVKMYYKMPAADNITGEATTCLKLIQEGKRTSTTRGPALGKVGDVITFEGDKVPYRITDVHKITAADRANPEWLAELSRTEGWTEEAILRMREFRVGQITTRFERVTTETRPGGVTNDIFDGSGIPIIPTNLEGVHGKGIAKQAAERGLVTKGKGYFADSTEKAVLFPTKLTWRQGSDLELIGDSFTRLGKLVDAHPDKTFLLPRVGMGLGGLSEKEVEPLIKVFLSEHPNVRYVSDKTRPGGVGKPPTSPQRMGEFGPPERQPATPGGMQDRPVATPQDIEDFRNNTMTPERLDEIIGYGNDEQDLAAHVELSAVTQELEGLKQQAMTAANRERYLNAELKVRERELENAKAMLSDGQGHVRVIDQEALENLGEQFKIIEEAQRAAGLAPGSTDAVTLESLGDTIDRAAEMLDKMDADPEGFRSIFYPGKGATLETEAAMEWQMNQWYFSRYNYSKLSKFIAGGPIKAMETFNSKKRLLFLNRWSIDDATTLYKTIVMAKVSTMLRIPLADEATRFITEGINPLQAWKKAKMLKDFDKMPQDIQFKISELIRKASDGPYSYIHYDAKGAFTHYQHIVTSSRRDATYSRFLLGKRLQEKGRSGQTEMDNEVARFLQGEHPSEQRLYDTIYHYKQQATEARAKGIPQAVALADELDFKAWYALGYRRDGALRGVASDSHRFIDESDVIRQTKPDQLYVNEVEGSVGGPAKEAVGVPGVRGDASGLVDALYHEYNYYYSHPILGKHWRPTRWKQLDPHGIDEWEVALRAGKVPDDMLFGHVIDGLFDHREAKRAWQSIGKLKVGDEVTLMDGTTVKATQQQIDRWKPVLTGQRVFDGIGPSFIHKGRDILYGILDYSGSKMNEMVYAHAFTENVDMLKKAAGHKLTEDEIIDIENRAHFTARAYTERVMFNNITYGGEEFLRNLVMFLPAYRQFAQYWAPYLAKHPFALSLVYRANRDKENLKVQAGPFEFNLARMSFLINQSNDDQHPSSVVTGWLPNGAPLLTVPVSTMAHFSRDDKDNVWGQLAGTWPFEFAGEFTALNSPLDKIFYGATSVIRGGEGISLPWPFGTDNEKNLWRAVQIQNEALRNHNKLMGREEAMWRVGVNRLLEGGFNFFSPVGGRIVDTDIESMTQGRVDYNKARTPEEVAAILAKPEMSTFKTFLKWQNLPSYEQLDFIAKHPEIVPYAVSGYSAGDNASGAVGILYDRMKDNGVPDPDLYVKRVGDMYKRIDLVLNAAETRKLRDEEETWWYTYKSTHSNLHQIERLQNEWDNSTGEFAPGGTFYIQGHHGIKEYRDALNLKYAGIDDPYTGLTYKPGLPEGDGYRLAKFMDQMGGATQKLLKMSPNYEMYVKAKYTERQENVTGLLKQWMEGRVSTRLTKEQIRQAGYSEEDTNTLDLVIKDIDNLWNTADAYAESAGGYASSKGRQIRAQAIEAQNAVIHSSPLTEQFLGDNIAALYKGTYLTTPVWKRTDYIQLDKMDKLEREMFQHLTTEIDPETGKPRLELPYLPEKAEELVQEGEILGYVPVIKGSTVSWRAKVRVGGREGRDGSLVGGVIGTIPCEMPDEARTLSLGWRETRSLLKGSFNNMDTTTAAVENWRYQLFAGKVPQWIVDLAEDDIRAQAWTAWLTAAGQARADLRETINVEYGGAAGYSPASKLGLQWKALLTDFGNSLSSLSPSFASEWERYNGDNVMTNSILDWYL